MDIFEVYDIIETLKKDAKPLPVRHCKNCNKKMRVIKNDFLNRSCCKKCHFNLLRK